MRKKHTATNNRGIVRYPNRKLYDYERRSYVTLEQLFGEAFRKADAKLVPFVRDHRTGADVTNDLLCQYVAQKVSIGEFQVLRSYLLSSFVLSRPAAA